MLDPLSRLECRELFGDQGDEDSTNRVNNCNYDINYDKESRDRPGRKVVKTKCGHSFHDACLMQVKVRKAECPYCRTPLTPILNPGAVSVAMENESLPSTTRRDAIIHASIRARNAVLRANEQRMRAARGESPTLQHSQLPSYSKRSSYGVALCVLVSICAIKIIYSLISNFFTFTEQVYFDKGWWIFLYIGRPDFRELQCTYSSPS